MSTYTPTTRQMEDSWASDGTEQPAAKSHDRTEGVAEFRRWLEQHDREVAVRAWEEGRESGASATMLNLSYGAINQPANPYEQEEA